MRSVAGVVVLSLVCGGTTLARAPDAVIVHTARGETRIPLWSTPGTGPLLSAPALLNALGGAIEFRGAWAEVVLGSEPFRFLVGAPLLVHGSTVLPLSAPALMRGDTLFVPLQFVAEILPNRLGARFRWDIRESRLADDTPAPTVAAIAATSASSTPPPGANGLRRKHSIAIDPGHGGVDPGNPGIYFPRGIREKNVTLTIGLLLREELRRRGVGVRMTRTTDTLINLGHRGRICTDDCELFVSLHVNSLERRRGYTKVRGFETYFLAEAKTEEAARVARMENEAVRFDQDNTGEGDLNGLEFIMKDLQMNEYLRESARFAFLAQNSLGRVHTGDDRGVKQAVFQVLTTARRPAVLIELGYSTNPNDGKLLTRKASQRAIASSIADAIMTYLIEFERRAGFAGDTATGPSR